MTIENVVGLKIIRWNQVANGFGSPRYPSFMWGQQRWVEATCQSCHKDNIPGDYCACGIYATVDHELLMYYHKDDAVALLVEACGKTWIHTKGFRAKEAEVIGIVNYDNVFKQLEPGKPINTEQLPMLNATHYYNVPLVSIDVAYEMARITFEREGVLCQLKKSKLPTTEVVE